MFRRSGRHGGWYLLVGRCRARGQTLTEFALVFPLFIFLTFGVIEFAFLFNVVLALDNASRNAALLAAESGNSPGGDCVILQQVLQDVGAPADPSRVQTVTIYWADQSGQPKAGSSPTIYDPSGSTTCTYPDNSTITVPLRQIQNGYPEASRCNVLAGCGASHPGLDVVGVKVSYRYRWVAPFSFAWLIQLTLGGPDITVERSNAMRMEPVL